MDKYYLFYQVKMIRKGSKPLLWRRGFVPVNVTFSQMALVLMELLEIPVTSSFEFEFYHRKDRVIERDTAVKPSFDYDYYSASETFVDRRFDEEDWFTFRILDPAIDVPEYRIEIENISEVLFIKKQSNKDGKEEERRALTFPIVKEQKALNVDPYWTIPETLNDRMMEKYQITYGEPPLDPVNVLVTSIEEQGTGIIAAGKKQDQEVLLIGSPNSAIKKMADLTRTVINKHGSEEGIEMLMDRPGYDEKDRSIADSQEAGAELLWSSRGPSLEKALKDVYTTAQLLEMAEDYVIPVSEKQKGKIAYEMARYLLTADNMRRYLLEAEPSDLDRFESLIKNGYSRPGDDEIVMSDVFYMLCYILEYKDGYQDVPEDVKTIYSTLQKTGYKEFHKKAVWTLKCMKAFSVHYVYAPTRILYRLYRSNKDLQDSFQEFQKLLEQIPSELCYCNVLGDHVAASNLPDVNVGVMIEEASSELQYYILDQNEIETFSAWEYPANEKAYQELETYLKQHGADRYTCRELLAKAYLDCSIGKIGIDDYTAFLGKKGFLPKKSKEKDQLVQILIRVYENTRAYIFRGHKPIETGFYNSATPASPYAIHFPGSSNGSGAAGTFTGEPFTGSPFSAAPSSAGPFTGNAVTGNPLSAGPSSSAPAAAEKKIYPNDPCPCGSGLKYKKCCGRK